MRDWMRRLAALMCLCLLFCAPWALAEQESGKAQDITEKCTVKVSEGDRHKLTDNNVRSEWTYSHSGAYVGVKLPAGVEAGWIRIEWMFDPTGFELIEYDGSKNVLRQRDQSATFPNIYTVLDLLPETVFIQLKMTAKDQSVCRLKIYSRGELPASVQVWNPPVAKADVMLVSTHQDDEVIFMGGTIPYYATALKKPFIVVYMANCTRYRRNAALNCLWKMGVRDYPEFINLQDKRVKSISEGVSLWGGKDAILSALVERIRRFKPEVIVTHDLNGEYGHNQHKITARAMKYAIDAAADPSRYPDSYNRYGAWQVKKLYHHLYKENEIMMDWETPLDSLNGYTPLKVAQIGMNEQASQLKYYQVVSHGKYDNARFGLYFSTVGEDVAKNDFLENIDPNASANYLAEHPEAAAVAQGNAAQPVEAVEATEEPPAQLEEAPAAQPEQIADQPVEAPEEALVEAAAPVDGEQAAPESADQPQPESADQASEAEAQPGGPEVQTPDTQAAQAPVSEESGGAMGLTAVAIVGGVAVLGAGGWYGYRMWSNSRGRRKRRGRARG